MNNVFSTSEAKLESSYFNKFILQVYGFMTFGVFITAMVAFGVLYSRAYTLSGSLFGLSLPLVFIIELAVVLILSFFSQKLNGWVALALFVFYAALNGIFFGILFEGYILSSIVIAFGGAFLTFGAMTTYGYFTKSDLTRWRNIAYMGLFGVVIGTLLNIFISFINPGLSNGLYWLITYVGLGVFIVLIAADTQKLKQIGQAAENNGSGTLNFATQGALILYLDFINLFLMILRISGKRR